MLVKRAQQPQPLFKKEILWINHAKGCWSRSGTVEACDTQTHTVRRNLRRKVLCPLKLEKLLIYFITQSITDPKDKQNANAYRHRNQQLVWQRSVTSFIGSK